MINPIKIAIAVFHLIVGSMILWFVVNVIMEYGTDFDTIIVLATTQLLGRQFWTGAFQSPQISPTLYSSSWVGDAGIQ